MDPFDLSQWGFSGLSFPELLSFQDHLPSDGDKDNHLLATPKRVSTPDCVSANLSSSPIPVEVPVVSAQEEPLVPLDLSRPSAARTCSEGLKEPSQSVASNKPLLVPDYPEIRLPRPFSSYNQLSSIPFFFSFVLQAITFLAKQHNSWKKPGSLYVNICRTMKGDSYLMVT